MPGPVSTWMADHLPTGKPSRYVTSHPDQLSLAIPPWVGAMSTSKSWGVQTGTPRDTLAPYPRHTTGHESWRPSWRVVCRGLKLVSVWGLRKETEISAALSALWLGKDFTFLLTVNEFSLSSTKTSLLSDPTRVHAGPPHSAASS